MKQQNKITETSIHWNELQRKREMKKQQQQQQKDEEKKIINKIHKNGY